MPHVSILRFTKDYRTVADALASMVKNTIITEREEDGHPVIDIEGDFSHFVLEDMDTWEARLKLEVKDFSIQDDRDRESRAILAQGIPGYGEVLFSPTIAFVYKQVAYRIVTTTIIERLEDGALPVVLSREGQESEMRYEWKDITKEFGRKVRIEK